MKGGVKFVLKIIKKDYDCSVDIGNCYSCPLVDGKKGVTGYGGVTLWGCGCHNFGEAERRKYIKGLVLQYLVREVGKDKFKELLVEELI